MAVFWLLSGCLFFFLEPKVNIFGQEGGVSGYLRASNSVWSFWYSIGCVYTADIDTYLRLLLTKTKADFFSK